MEDRKKTKMCPHCDGILSIDAVSCHFCGRNIFNDSFVYKNNEKSNEEEDDKISYKPIYVPQEESESVASEAKKEENESTEYCFFNLLFFVVGMSLLTFSGFLYLFSIKEDLIFKLCVNNRFLYFLLAIPCIFLGFKNFNKKKNS